MLYVFIMFIIQFGLCTPDIKKPDSQDTIECNSVFEKAEEHFVSWIYWDTADNSYMGPIFMENGNINKDTAAFFVRPYPIATAGVPIKVGKQQH